MPGHEPSAGLWDLLHVLLLSLRESSFGAKMENQPWSGRLGRLAAAGLASAPVRQACVDAPPRRAGSARSICAPRAPDLQSVAPAAERRPRKSAPPAPPIQSVNAKWSKLTRRQPPWLQVGEAPYSLHRPASMQPRGAPFRRACMQKSRPLDHRDYPIDIARGPRGGREPIKRVSNEALQALCARAPLARRRSGRRQAVPFRRIRSP